MLDIGIIIALCVAVTLTLTAGVAAGLFGGMWWQAQKTAEVWEKTYTHLREQITPRALDTYNVAYADPQGDRAALTATMKGLIKQELQAAGLTSRDRVRVQADVAPVEVRVQTTVAPPPAPPLPPITPSSDAQRFGRTATTEASDFELEDDPFAPQVRK